MTTDLSRNETLDVLRKLGGDLFTPQARCGGVVQGMSASEVRALLDAVPETPTYRLGPNGLERVVEDSA